MKMEGTRGQRTGEIVPIADRARYMDGFRAALVALVAAIAMAAPAAVTVPRTTLVYTTAGYAALALVARLLSAAAPRVSLLAFGGMLLVDGAFLAWSGYVTGAAESPIRFVMVLHVIAVALLASYRTGLKIALWHSLLLIVAFYAQRDGLLDAAPSPGIGIGTPFARLLEFSALFWVASMATSAFSAVNERELRRRRYDTEALATMATKLESVTAPGEVAETVVTAVAETFDFERVLLIAAPDDAEPAVLASHGAVEAAWPVRFDPDSSALANACTDRTSVLVANLDPEADPWLSSVLPGARNVIAVPLTAEGQSVGVLVAVQGRRLSSRITRRVVSMVERFASHGTLALRNAWLLAQVRRMATTDALTGVTNRAAFDDLLSAELARAARHGQDAALLMLDIDHFKRLNDEHGHQAGDEVLRLVGVTLRETSREYDTPARYGGEEFAVILPATSRDEGVKIAERVRAAIAAMPTGLNLTASFGVATFPLDGVDPEALIRAADGALYRSKRDGRNRVTAASAPEAAAPAAAPGT